MRLELPPEVMNSLPKNIVDDFILLQDDIGDITACREVGGYFIGLGHFVDGKFIRYSFDDPKKELAIREIELEYAKEYYEAYMIRIEFRK